MLAGGSKGYNNRYVIVDDFGVIDYYSSWDTLFGNSTAVCKLCGGSRCEKITEAVLTFEPDTGGNESKL